MDLAVVLLLACVVALAPGLIVLARRTKRLERERDAARSVIATVAKRPAPTIEAGIKQIAEQSAAAQHRESLICVAVEQVAVGVAVFDPSLNVLFATVAVQQMLDGRHTDSAAAARVREVVRGVVDTGRSNRVRLEEHGQAHRVLSIEAAPVPADVGPAVVVQIHDITDAERVDAIRQDFAANVSHELKTPVGAIGVLAEAIAATDDEVARKRLASRLVDESERLATLVDDVIHLSTVEGENPEAGKVDLVAVTTEACRRLEALAEQRQVALELDVSDQPVVVQGDRRQLVSAVSNLVENAIKYGSVMGAQRASVEVRVVRLEDEAVVAVEDHGIGIADHHQSRIFERFYRVARSRGRANGGTGLGLAIVRHVALNHNGEVSVESTPGVGSVFRLRLPAAED